MSPIVSPRRPHARSHRPALRVLGGYGDSSERQPSDLDMAEARRPALRVVAEDRDEAAPVLLAGADPCRRAVLRIELSATLPPCTEFTEATDVSSVLERAPLSRMVVLAGDLCDTDAGSLMRLLGRRHPQLPVVSVEANMPAAAGGRG
jgi:hypothetical protein